MFRPIGARCALTGARCNQQTARSPQSLAGRLEAQQQAPAVAYVEAMAKSLRSKIKRRFRTELRKRIGVPHQQAQEAKIQENLQKALQAQGERSNAVVVT